MNICDIPFSGHSLASTRENKTGSWKNVAPLYIDRTSSCADSCLAGEDIPVQIQLVAEGRYREAVQVLRLANPFPASVGRVCPAPCEAGCLRGNLGGAVSIRQIERFIGDYAITNSMFCRSKKKRHKKIAVIGAGPAGLAAAYFLGMEGYQVTVYEEKDKAGGLLRYGIPEFRLPKNILDKELKIVFGRLDNIKFRFGTRIDGKSLPSLDRLSAVLLCCGKNVSSLPDINGVTDAMCGVSFLELVAKEGPPVLSGKVAVIGGGSTAFDCARVSLRCGAEPVIYYRRSLEEMPAFSHDIEGAQEEKIRIINNVAPVNVNVERNGRYRITFARTVSKGRGSPLGYVPGSEFDIVADRVLFATGEKQEVILPGLQGKGPVDVDDSFATARTKFFAAGDMTSDAPGTVAGAIMQGRLAAMSVHACLSGKENRSGRILSHERGAVPEIVTFDRLNRNFFTKLARKDSIQRGVKYRSGNFDEIDRGMEEVDIKYEAGRCFVCGTCNLCFNCINYCPDNAISFDKKRASLSIKYDYCKGCLICVRECPRYCMGFK